MKNTDKQSQFEKPKVKVTKEKINEVMQYLINNEKVIKKAIIKNKTIKTKDNMDVNGSRR
jgi:hypothetical protein